MCEQVRLFSWAVPTKMVISAHSVIISTEYTISVMGLTSRHFINNLPINQFICMCELILNIYIYILYIYMYMLKHSRECYMKNKVRGMRPSTLFFI